MSANIFDFSDGTLERFFSDWRCFFTLLWKLIWHVPYHGGTSLLEWDPCSDLDCKTAVLYSIKAYKEITNNKKKLRPKDDRIIEWLKVGRDLTDHVLQHLHWTYIWVIHGHIRSYIMEQMHSRILLSFQIFEEVSDF